MKISHALALPALLAAITAQSAEPAADLGPLKSAGTTLLARLGAELKQEMTAHGPEGAVAVCRDAAPRIAGELSRQTGMKVSRVSLKTRNPLLGTPDAWEQAALQGLDARAAKGEKPETLEISEIVTEPAGRSLRFLKALPMQSVCLTCHGTDIPAPVKDRLAAAYPNDKATGYALGQLRGAVSVKKALAD